MREFASSHANCRLMALALGSQWKAGKETFQGCDHGGKLQRFSSLEFSEPLTPCAGNLPLLAAALLNFNGAVYIFFTRL